jgi:hypothetical protein
LSIATSVETCSARIGQGFVGLDDDGKVQLDVLGRNGLDSGEETVAVRSITNWSCRHTTEANLVEEVKLAIRLEAGVEQMRRV